MQSNVFSTIQDSQTTLVNRAPPITLVFSHNGSILNASVTVASKPLYIITTEDNLGSSKTNVLDALTQPQRLVACIDRRSILPATVAFPERNGGKAVRISKWIKSAKLSDGFPVSVIETDIGKCFWKIHVVHRWALYTEHNLDTPIAYMQPATSSSPPALVLQSDVAGFMDQIITSFLILEQNLRMNEKTVRVADGKAKFFSLASMDGGALA